MITDIIEKNLSRIENEIKEEVKVLEDVAKKYDYSKFSKDV